MDKNKFSFNSLMSDYEIINPEFARVKIYVCYAGKNRNMTEISQEVLDKMSSTIYGIPVVAEYDKDENCFKGHGGKVEITDDGMEWINTTVPYGFVDPNTKAFYEEVREIDGITVNKYLCCYAYLWYKRYPEVESVLKNQDNKKIGQSMEIMVNDFDYGNDGYYVIKDAYFSGLAMLGVEPCFESAKVTSNFSKEEYSTKTYEEMINAFKKYTLENSTKEADKVEENLKTEVAELDVQAEATESSEVVETKEEFVEDVCPTHECPLEDGECPQCEADEESDSEDEDFAKKKKKKCSDESEESAEIITEVEELISETNEEDEEFAKKKKKKCSLEEIQETEEYKSLYNSLQESNLTIGSMAKELDSANKTIDEYSKTIEQLTSENNYLKEFKNKIENEGLKLSVDNIAKEFTTLSDVDKEGLVKKAYAKEITLEELDLHLSAMAYKRKTFSLNKEDLKPRDAVVGYSLNDEQPKTAYPSLETYINQVKGNK